jgi:hypothetical protein
MTTAVGVTMRDILDAGLKVEAYSNWHDEAHKPDGYKWHASSLTFCTRREILKRAGYVMDMDDPDQAMLLEQAKMIHEWMERAITAYCADPSNEAEILVTEIGYTHTTLNLRAKPDALLSIRGVPVLVDYKTEKEGGMSRRQDAAKAAGSRTSARYEHQIQLAATAMCLETNGYPAISEGRVWYLSRQEWFTDEQPVDLGDSLLRLEVERKIHALDEAWAAYEGGAVLPHRIDLEAKPQEKWKCATRTKDPLKGKFCPARQVCYDRRMPA